MRTIFMKSMQLLGLQPSSEAKSSLGDDNGIMRRSQRILTKSPLHRRKSGETHSKRSLQSHASHDDGTNSAVRRHKGALSRRMSQGNVRQDTTVPVVTTAIICLLLPSIPVAGQSLAVQQQGVSSWKKNVTGRTSSVTRQTESLLFPGRSQPLKLAKKQTSKKQEQQDALDFSSTGRPGQQTAGESRGSCANASSFQALLPVSRTGKTVLKHPRFWVYFPKALTQKSQVEFVVQNEAREDIWRSRSQLEQEPGYKSFSWPDTAAPLEIGQWYRWYVKIYCDSQVASAQYVQGWVSRMPINSQLHLELIDNPQDNHLIYGNHRLWYDAVDHLLSNYQNNPLNLGLEQDWQNLIGAGGVDLQGLPSIGGSYEAVDSTQINHQATE